MNIQDFIDGKEDMSTNGVSIIKAESNIEKDLLESFGKFLSHCKSANIAINILDGVVGMGITSITLPY